MDSAAGAGATSIAGTASSTYVREPALLRDMPARPPPVAGHPGRPRAGRLGDSITTDHISPAGSIKAQDGPAGRYLVEPAACAADFNSYGSRRGNTKSWCAARSPTSASATRWPGDQEGGWTRHLPDGEVMSDLRRRDEVQGRLTTASPPPARKANSRPLPRPAPPRAGAPRGARAVIAESFERIHRTATLPARQHRAPCSFLVAKRRKRCLTL